MTHVMIAKEIGGRVFQIRKLPLIAQRVVYARFAKLLGVFTQLEELAAEGGSAFMTCTMLGMINQEDMQFYCDQFGPSTTVEWDESKTLFLKDAKAQETVFGDDYAQQFEWLDACFALNFETVLAKMNAALQTKKDAAAAAATDQ
jgi:hypothetical protein